MYQSFGLDISIRTTNKADTVGVSIGGQIKNRILLYVLEI